MNKPILMAILINLIVCSSSSAITEEFRSFTDSKGRKIEAKLVEYNSKMQTVKLRLQNGKTAKIKISILSDNDQVLIKNWHASQYLLSKNAFRVNFTSKILESGTYSDMRDNWTPNSSGMDFEDSAFEITFNNMSANPLNEIRIRYILFYESDQKKRFLAYQNGQLVTDQKRYISLNYALSGEYTITTLKNGKSTSFTTDSVRLKAGIETRKHSESQSTRDLEEKIRGIILQVSLPQPSGNRVDKLYSYPPDFLKKQEFIWKPTTDRKPFIVPETTNPVE